MSRSDDEATKDMTDESSTVGSDADQSSAAKSGAADGQAAEPSVRAARRAQREAERAARAQRKADAARRRAMDAARAGGLFEGMQASSDGTADHGTADDGTADDGTADTTSARVGGTDPVTDSPTSTRKVRVREPMDAARQRKLTVTLAIVSVLLLVVAGLATWQYFEAREATAAEEQIANASAAATDAAREIGTQMFTYDHRTVDADLAGVRPNLTEPALGEFVEQSMPTVASAAKQQEATVYATVAAAAPQEVVDENNVTVLVMLNRMVSTKDAPEAASSASRLSLRMERDGDTWKLAKLNAL